MNLLSTNKRVDSMYINPNTFSKIFQEYCDKVNQKKAEKIPYGSWQVLHRLDTSWPKEIGSNDLCWDSSLTFNQETLTKITISYIYGTDVTVEVDIPSEFYTELIKRSTLVPSSLIPDSCCTAATSIHPISPNYLNNWWESPTTISLTTDGWTIKDGSLVFNSDGSVSICDDSRFKTVISGASYEKEMTSIYQDKEKENDNSMNIPAMKFDFGPANADAVAMSPYGLAIRCGDSWYAYNAKDSQTIDVTGMTFSFKNAIYKMPVAVNQVKEGDLIIHQKKAMYVVQVNDKTSIEVIDLAASEQKTVIPVSNMFGFNYVTKVAPLFNLGTITPSAENPFGNILPMMMMSSMFEDDKSNKSEGNDFMQMMLMMSLMNGTNPFSAMFAGAGPQAE